MKDHPIIFSVPMVTALLCGRKTMTRRLAWQERHLVREDGIVDATMPIRPWPSPWQKVKPGDRLWVREGFTVQFCNCHPACVGLDYCADPGSPSVNLIERPDREMWKKRVENKLNRRFPSIHMPRWASRITLRLTAVKVERIQNIDHYDAINEGMIDNRNLNSPRWSADGVEWHAAPGVAFKHLWKKLHGEESWEANPEVICLTFKTIKQNIDAMKEAA